MNRGFVIALGIEGEENDWDYSDVRHSFWVPYGGKFWTEAVQCCQSLISIFDVPISLGYGMCEPKLASRCSVSSWVQLPEIWSVTDSGHHSMQQCR